MLFDDFSYSMSSQMPSNGWYVRSGGGGPGAANGTWSADYVSFYDDSDASSPNNKIMRMKASTQGAGGPTVQSQVTFDGGYIKGTYAARVYFNNDPISGPDGDHIVETFYTITPLEFDNAPDYSELDFEYLANGGWGTGDSTMFLTSWETYQPDPWVADNTHDFLSDDYSGWHVLMMQVDDDEIRYYIDKDLVATHSGKYYPETPMSINFNIWFIDTGFINNTEERVYEQEVDWLYFAKDQIISVEYIVEQVVIQRMENAVFVDTTD